MNLPPVLAKPYRLHNTIQHYAWGASGPDAYIPRLIGFEPDPGTPYAELWIGAHPKAPSQVIMMDDPNHAFIPLDQWIAQYPEAILGKRVAMQFGGTLPFLVKVLSAGASLSIQAHPDKTQAERLHAQDPEHYADDNHKPEIAVALDRLSALMGFKPYADILQTLQDYPELADFLGKVLVVHLLDAANKPLAIQRIRVHQLFDVLIKRSLTQPGTYTSAVDALVARLRGTARDEVETLFLSLHQQYGSADVGLFAFLLFNLVHLTPGEALYTPAGVPHAYLSGNIIECMANSDNVVRVGLTPKYRDAAVLLEIMDTTPQVPRVMSSIKGAGETTFITPAKEFELIRWSLDPGMDLYGMNLYVEAHEGPAILIITSGVVQLSWQTPGGMESINLLQGESVLLPHVLQNYTVKAVDKPAQVFRTAVPA